MKNVILFASIALASGIFFTNIYSSLIDARSWGSNMPNSIAAAREYFKMVNPGNFFRIFSPVNQVLAVVALIVFWKTGSGVRLSLVAAVVLYVMADIFTFAYFYPRNNIMFSTASLTDTDLLRKTWSQWSTMNWVRSLIMLAGLCSSFLALYKLSFMHSAAPMAVR